MNNYDLKISAKGSRKTGEEFMAETDYLAKLVNCIEIDFNYPHDRNFESEIEHLRKLKKTRGLNYTVHAQYFSGSINDLNEEVREASVKEILRNIDNASLIGAEIVTLHPGLEPYGLKLEQRQNLEIKSYRKIAVYAASKSIAVGLENEAQTCFWFPDRACKFELIKKTVQAVNATNFLYTLDIGHANVSGENYIEALKKLEGQIVHIHAHDNLGGPEENLKAFQRPDPHLAPGKGKIDWKKVINTLRETNYQNYFELECEIKEMEAGISYIKNL